MGTGLRISEVLPKGGADQARPEKSRRLAPRSLFYEALIDAAPVLRAFAKKGTKPTPYRESPYELFSRQDKKQQKQLQEKHDDQAKAYMEAFMVSVNKKFQEKGGGVSG